MFRWKYGKERLAKHKYVAHIINAKKVICICGKEIKLNRRYEEDYLNRHVARSGCKADEGQRTIYSFFKPTTVENIESSDEEWDSDVYDNMDEDDVIQVDEESESEEIDDSSLSTFYADDNDTNTKNISKKRRICIGLQSLQISDYIKRTPVQFGGSRRVEVVARQLFPKLFSNKFSRKKLNLQQKRKLNRVLFAESVWKIDRSCKLTLILNLNLLKRNVY